MPEQKNSIRNILIPRVSLTLFFCLIFISPCLAGWGTTEVTLKGYCRDNKTGWAINNAQVKLFSASNTLISSTTSNPNGYYTFKKQLPSGNYLFTCSASGYETSSKSLYLKAGQTYSINFYLKKQTQNNPPKITVFTPKDKSTFVTGDNINISVTASDPDRDPLQYRYTIDNKVLKDWTPANTFRLPTTKTDWGRHRIKVEVKDTKLATDSKSADIYIFLKFPKPAGQ